MSRSRGMGDDTERFVRDVDRLLAGQPPEETTDDAYQADLELAHLLGRVQFALDSRFKSHLRSHLLRQLYDEEVRTMSLTKVFRSLVRPVLVAGLSAVIVLGVVLAASPTARVAAQAAAQKLVARFVEVDSPWALLSRAEKRPALAPLDVTAVGDVEKAGDAASADKPVPPSPETAPQAGEPEFPTPGEKSPVESLSADELPVPDAQPSRELTSLEEAQTKLDFQIRVPTVLPEGYSFLGVVPTPEAPPAPNTGIEPPASLPKAKPPQMAILLFSHTDGGLLTLSEMRISGPVPDEVPLPAGGNAQEVTVNGRPAQYIEGRWTQGGWVAGGHYQLHWQDADGIMFDLVSDTLALEELLAVAESLE